MDRHSAIALLYEGLIQQLGEDGQREALADTPKRAALAFEELTEGYQKNLDEIVKGALFHTNSESLVMIKDIELYSLCEHHLLPFIGRCHIGYVPNGQVLGLSKFARIVEMYARRLQIQEELTHQIAKAVLEMTQAHGVGVVIEANHLCMMMRGIQKQSSSMCTSVMLGTLRTNAQTRQEFLQLLH